MKIFSRFVLVIAALGASLPAQTPAPPATAATEQNPTFKAGAEETVLDVVVRDKKGRLVKDLKESDFTIMDNGQSRPIKSFRIVEGTEAINSSGGRMQLDPLRQLRLITLVFQGGDQNAKKLARDAAMELIKGELAQNVYISVMAIDHKLQALQPFTNDRNLLRKAIARATASVNDYTNDTIQVRKDLEQMLGPMQGGDPSLAGRTDALSTAAASGSGPGAATTAAGGAAQAAMAQLMVTILRNAQSDEASDWSRASVFPLLDLVKEQYRLPGRKTIMYFSGGFPITQSVEDPFKQIISIANRANVSFYSVDINGLTTYSTAGNANSGLNDAAASSAKNVTSSTTGISMGDAQAADMALDAGKKDTQLTIKMLAEQTGGVLIANTNDFRTPIRKVTEDVQSYYEITYDPQIQKYDGAFRKVAVKTDIADLRVQSRAGYFALPPNLTQGGQVLATYEVPLLQALDTQPLKSDFPFQSAAMHFRGGACEVVVDIPVGGLTFEENKQANVFDGKLAYVAVVKGADGQVVKKLRQEVPMRVTPDKVAAYKASSHFIYNEEINLGPGKYTLETAVLDMQSQKLSAKKASFEIPAPSESLGMSSVAMVRNTKAKDANSKADDPMLMAGKVIMPMVNPTLKKADYDALSFYMTIYPNKKNFQTPTLVMVFSKDGQVLGKANAPALGAPDAEGRIQYVATAPASALPVGKWEIHFIAQQGDESADDRVAFTLE